MSGPPRFDAFLSYRHVEPDRRWARWLHGALETYRVPRRLVAERGCPARLGRVFRDEEELPASSDLSTQIRDALDASRFLIVVCSPRTPGSRWVDAEVQRFRELGRHDRILALLIEGEPGDAFPRALCEIRRTVTDESGHAVEELEAVEPLAADVRSSRPEPARQLRHAAKLRLLACVLGVRYDDLVQRDARRRQRRWALATAASLVLVAAAVLLAAFALRARAAEQRARTVAERALARGLVREGEALGLLGRWPEARARHADARARLVALGRDTLAADIGLWKADRACPPPVTVVTHGAAVTGLAVTPDGLLWTAGGGRTVRGWDPATGELREEFQADAPAHGLAVSHDGSTLAVVADGRIELRDAKTRRRRAAHGARSRRAVPSADGRRFLDTADAGGRAARAVAVREAASGAVLASAPIELWLESTAGEPGSGGGWATALGYQSGTFVMVSHGFVVARGPRLEPRWTIETGEDIEGAPLALAWPAPGRLWFVTGHYSGRTGYGSGEIGGLHRVDARTGAVRARMATFRETPRAVAASGDLVAVMLADGAVRAWRPGDDGDGELRPAGSWELAAPGRSLVVAPGGAWLAAGAEDGRVRVWIPGERPGVESFSVGDVVIDIRFDRGGRGVRAFSRLGETFLFDRATGVVSVSRELPEPEEDAAGEAKEERTADGRRLARSPDGRYAVRVDGPFAWTILGPDGDEIASFREPVEVNALAWAPDGRAVLWCGADRVVRLYDFDSPAELARLRRRGPRAEWLARRRAAAWALRLDPDHPRALWIAGRKDEARAALAAK